MERGGQRGSPEWRQASRRRDRSATRFLRGEWAFFRKLFGQHKDGQHTPGRYQFDRHELLPLRSPNGSIQYLAQYIGKDFGRRSAEDRGVRRVSYGRGVAQAAGRLTMLGPGNDNCRDKLKLVAELFGLGPADYERGFKRMLGPRWGYHVLKAVQGLKLPLYRTGVHAYLDGIINRTDIEFGFPLPLADAVEVRYQSSEMGEQLAAAYAQVAQARYYHNRHVPWPELPSVAEPPAGPQLDAPESAGGAKAVSAKKGWIELSLKED